LKISEELVCIIQQIFLETMVLDLSEIMVLTPIVIILFTLDLVGLQIVLVHKEFMISVKA
jgi:hypothetical protein